MKPQLELSEDVSGRDGNTLSEVWSPSYKIMAKRNEFTFLVEGKNDDSSTPVHNESRSKLEDLPSTSEVFFKGEELEADQSKLFLLPRVDKL